MARTAIVSLLAAALLSGCGAAEPPAVSVPERPAGTIVVLSDSNRLTAIDVATGRRTARRIRSVPACGAELFVTGGHIVFSAVLKGRTTVFSVPLALDRRPRRLGAAHMFVASATEGRVWLTGTDCDRVRMVGVRELTVNGEMTFENDRRVPGTYVAGAVPEGLLVSRGRTLDVWDPVTGAARRLDLEWAWGIEGSLLAGCVAGSECNTLAILDVASGRSVPVRSSERRVLDMGGAFSPGGGLLATPARKGRRYAVALVDARTGRHTIIPGSRTGRVYPELEWARSSGWLFIRDGRRLRAYRPGAGRAETLPIRLPRSALAFTVD
jgi:hypothetical protein